MYLGENIKFLRTKKGWTQDRLRAFLGYKSTSSIAKWETGEANPPVSVVHRLAELFNTDIDTLTMINMEFGFTSARNFQSCEVVLSQAYQRLNSEGKDRLMEYADYLLTKPEYIDKDGEE